MKYESIKEIEEEKFRRLTGVKKSTFEKMISINIRGNEIALLIRQLKTR